MSDRTATTSGSTTDDVLEALADDRRRRILRALRDGDGPVSLEELAAEVARRERADARGSPPDVERIETALYHVHLPKLDDAGLVTRPESEEPTRVTATGPAEPEVSDLLALREA